ncbi:2Fe-2S iron-sulfur cluster binding domain-containing protein [Corynebacterium poyangense]|uniref:2Fe-2S iron-sulfur cluster binding domain-containing protein n=1 Tax=Corynebacterium poyangense TaxID=2684405 RepID=A0A7H0SKY2_9CORY|nr:PDR/VanB family oxidoreductase [Corynebacterium poyangense]QNQ89207.1 2Fe-2S iron-sulfur cluster binding domain-containing protein [Corynebacterium poyangense]
MNSNARTITKTPHKDDIIQVRVAGRKLVGKDIVQLTLESLTGEKLPDWEPGAHIDVMIPGDSSEPLIRQYSLCGDYHDNFRYEIGVLKTVDSRGGSRFIHEHFTVGTVIKISEPRNHFPLVPSSNYVFVAGGIGITPLIPMVRKAIEGRKPWKFYQLAENNTRRAFPDIVDNFPKDHTIVHFSDENGMMDLELLAKTFEDDTDVYACGPAGLLDGLATISERQDRWRFHCERFSPREFYDAEEDKSFTVVIDSSGDKVLVPPGKSCLQSLREHGLKLDWSCKEGVCGTCETDVLEGVPEHRDSVLTAEERASNESMMICVSRAKTSYIKLRL